MVKIRVKGNLRAIRRDIELLRLLHERNTKCLSYRVLSNKTVPL